MDEETLRKANNLSYEINNLSKIIDPECKVHCVELFRCNGYPSNYNTERIYIDDETSEKIKELVISESKIKLKKLQEEFDKL